MEEALPPLYRVGDSARVVALEGTSEPEPYRTQWRRDYARIIHSAAFRRLQGKTQLFPGHESDFFRNRLTHSLEVAQIAKSIALRINASEPAFSDDPIDLDLVETAALAHDLGHPPFGHNGEEALDECMREFGGFEGNAQSLRIVSRLEKRQRKQSSDDDGRSVAGGIDQRAGLNLTYRTMAAMLKYDHAIPREAKLRRGDRGTPVKGYYYTEAGLVAAIKAHVAPGAVKFRTIECSIMDVADDVAYSTYDLEDAFKAGFLEPLSMLSASPTITRQVAQTVAGRLERYYPDLPSAERAFSSTDVSKTLIDIFESVFVGSAGYFKRKAMDDLSKAVGIANDASSTSARLAADGYHRTRLTSDLVGAFIRGVTVKLDWKTPALSQARLDVETFKRVEVLKNFTYESLIMSSMLKVARYRGKDIVRSIFGAIEDDDGHLLMPDDFRAIYDDLTDTGERRRVICDFIAGMTDRYAIQFYGRLRGTNPESIYSPI